MSVPVVHVVELAKERRDFDVARCAQMLLDRGAEDQDVMEIYRLGRLVRTGLLSFVARRAIPHWVLPVEDAQP